MAYTKYLGERIVKHFITQTDIYEPPDGPFYLALWNVNPTLYDASDATEVSIPGYERKIILLENDPVNVLNTTRLANTNNIRWDTSLDWGKIRSFAIFDEKVAGNPLIWFSITGNIISGVPVGQSFFDMKAGKSIIIPIGTFFVAVG